MHNPNNTASFQAQPQQFQQYPQQPQTAGPQYAKGNFQPAAVPQTYPQQPNAVPDYFTDFQSSATGQIGMQLGTQALSQAQQHLSSNVGRYFNITQWRYYFNVSNSYVLNKLQLLLFPFLHKSDDQGQVGSYSPPRSDLNAPDLYIPTMSFVTYVIIVGIASGLTTATTNSFSPDVLGITASTAFFLVFLEVLFVKMGNYFLSITADAPMLELFAYCGYKFIP
ncbi:hypothetical protein HDU91_000313 [Kappamyces sp. JEL0680]|nr:hypothetical protein HDU91_000313 [Kappamyces sp. JEL0680]